MNYDELLKRSLNLDIFDKTKMFDSIREKIEEENLKEKLTILLLLLIQKQDSCGFELLEKLDIILKKKLENKEGFIYPILHSLENKNYIKAYWTNNDTHKKIYTITLSGKNFLKEKDEVVEFFKQPNQIIYKESFLWN